jgi:hypothetical protein
VRENDRTCGLSGSKKNRVAVSFVLRACIRHCCRPPTATVSAAPSPFFLLNLPTWHSYTATVQKIISLCPIFLQPKRDCRGDNFVTAQRRYGTARKGGYYFLDKKQLCEIKSVHQINSQKIRRRRIRREKGAYDTIIPATDWLPRRPAAT